MFDLTDEQRAIQRLTREFAEGEIKPIAEEIDREHRFPYEVIEKAGELGLMGVCVPEEQGGAGADFLSYVLVLEELSRADAGRGRFVGTGLMGLAFTLTSFTCTAQGTRASARTSATASTTSARCAGQA